MLVSRIWSSLVLGCPGGFRKVREAGRKQYFKLRRNRTWWCWAMTAQTNKLMIKRAMWAWKIQVRHPRNTTSTNALQKIEVLRHVCIALVFLMTFFLCVCVFVFRAFLDLHLHSRFWSGFWPGFWPAFLRMGTTRNTMYIATRPKENM